MLIKEGTVKHNAAFIGAALTELLHNMTIQTLTLFAAIHSRFTITDHTLTKPFQGYEAFY